MDNGLKEKVDFLEKKLEVSDKGNVIEFKNMHSAFIKFGNLIDLLYLEVAVLIDLLAQKKIITEKEFATMLEETGKKIEEQSLKDLEASKKKDEPSRIIK